MADHSRRARALEWSRVRVGAVLIIGLLLLAYGIYQVGSLFDVFADRYTLLMPVDQTGGLMRGAPVTLSGERVGQVDDIEFIPLPLQEGGHNVMIHLSVAEDVHEHIREDSEGQILTQGLMGMKYVNIEPGSPPYAVLQPGDTLPSEPTADLDRILAVAYETVLVAQGVLADLQTVTTAIRQGEGTLGRLIVDDSLYERALAAASNAAELIEGLNRGEGTLGRLMTDPTLYQRLTAAVARVDSLAGVILSGEGTLGQLVRNDSLYQSLLGLVTRAQETVATADSAIAGLGGFVGRLGEGEGTLQRLLTDPRLYDEFLKAVIDLQALIAQFRETPPDVNVNLRVF